MTVHAKKSSYLTEPKSHVVFRRPVRPLTARSFARDTARRGLKLALTTQMLFRGNTIFINGEACQVRRPLMRLLTRLADQRSLPPVPLADLESAQLLYQWYRAGYIHVNGGE